MVIMEGRADKPVYLYIDDETVEIKDASKYWGMVSSEVTNALTEVHPGTNVMCIGPAGEKLSPMAAIMNDVDRAAGRGGVGAVMGSKNLKAVVVKGTEKVEVADSELAKKVNSEKVNILRNDPVAGNGLPTYGTAILVNIINENGMHPVRNFQESYTEKAELNKW